MTDEISECLDIDPIEDEPLERFPIVHSPMVRENAEDDYEQVRQSMKDMIADGTDAISTLSKLAKESESPRAYEVFANTLKTITEMNKALMNLHKDAKDIMAQKDEGVGDGTEKGDGTITFTGSTEELQRHLKTINGK